MKAKYLRNKFRICAAALAGTMVMSMAVPAFAEEYETEPQVETVVETTSYESDVFETTNDFVTETYETVSEEVPLTEDLVDETVVTEETVVQEPEAESESEAVEDEALDAEKIAEDKLKEINDADEVIVNGDVKIVINKDSNNTETTTVNEKETGNETGESDHEDEETNDVAEKTEKKSGSFFDSLLDLIGKGADTAGNVADAVQKVRDLFIDPAKDVVEKISDKALDGLIGQAGSILNGIKGSGRTSESDTEISGCMEQILQVLYKEKSNRAEAVKETDEMKRKIQELRQKTAELEMARIMGEANSVLQKKDFELKLKEYDEMLEDIKIQELDENAAIVKQMGQVNVALEGLNTEEKRLEYEAMKAKYENEKEETELNKLREKLEATREQLMKQKQKLETLLASANKSNGSENQNTGTIKVRTYFHKEFHSLEEAQAYIKENNAEDYTMSVTKTTSYREVDKKAAFISYGSTKYEFVESGYVVWGYSVTYEEL